MQEWKGDYSNIYSILQESHLKTSLQAHPIPDKTSTTGIHLEQPLIRKYSYQNALATIFQNNESQRLASLPPRQESNNELCYSRANLP